MNSPTEKAYNMLYKYLHSGKLHSTKVKYMGAGQTEEHYDENVEIESAKQCALIAVEEILQVIEDNSLEYDDNYWGQVKEELTKM